MSRVTKEGRRFCRRPSSTFLHARLKSNYGFGRRSIIGNRTAAGRRFKNKAPGGGCRALTQRNRTARLLLGGRDEVFERLRGFLDKVDIELAEARHLADRLLVGRTQETGLRLKSHVD